jgi:hypothetical protein
VTPYYSHAGIQIFQRSVFPATRKQTRSDGLIIGVLRSQPSGYLRRYSTLRTMLVNENALQRVSRRATLLEFQTTGARGTSTRPHMTMQAQPARLLLHNSGECATVVSLRPHNPNKMLKTERFPGSLGRLVPSTPFPEKNNGLVVQRVQAKAPDERNWRGNPGTAQVIDPVWQMRPGYTAFPMGQTNDPISFQTLLSVLSKQALLWAMPIGICPYGEN